MNNTNNNISFTPVIIYHNANSNKSKILANNKNKAGIYMWIHIQSNKKYVGSALNLSERMYKYFSPLSLKRTDNYISRALIHHGYSVFSLSIIEFIDITNLSKKEARKLILEREQYYLDLIFSQDEPNTYNINPTAESRLGSKHTEDSLAKMSIAQSGKNNPMYGKISGNHPKGMLGKSHSQETIKKMSGKNNPMYGKTGENHPMSKSVFVYSFDSETKNIILYKSFNTCIEAAKFFDCSIRTLSRYLDKNKLYKNQWILLSEQKQ